jgi:GTPase-associated protein 1, N-terminal domain type 1
VVTIDAQVHGYRRGHQLLASSIDLDRRDQALLDRLSDIAGPLGPGETFRPYLTSYALPGESHYVLARTWQDIDAPRAGCVRTLSLLIPLQDWKAARTLEPLLQILDGPEPPSTARRTTVHTAQPKSLPPAPPFNGTELIEALFLEESKPIAIFDVPDPDIVAVRLLTAFWPEFRGRFLLSTMALSPRKIEGRSFDLVFAPQSARHRFADWRGRRIDGRSEPVTPRHRWTQKIFDRVFEQPRPQLLDNDDVEFFVGEGDATSAEVRLALLWEELTGKLSDSPTAALGLLDIANARRTINRSAIRRLGPTLARAAQQAVSQFPPFEAWSFLGAMIRKLRGQFSIDSGAVRRVSVDFARRNPKAALDAIAHAKSGDPALLLVREVACGLAEAFNMKIADELAVASLDVLVQLLVESRSLAAQAVGASGEIVDRLSRLDSELPAEQFDVARKALLPILVERSHLVAAAPMIETLEPLDLLQEVRDLHAANGLAVADFAVPVVARAKSLGCLGELRDLLLSLPSKDEVNTFVRATLSSTHEDLAWVLGETKLASRDRLRLMIEMFRSADSRQLREMVADSAVAEQAITLLEPAAVDVLLRIAFEAQLPLPLHVRTILRLLPKFDGREKIELAFKALEGGLKDSFGGDEIGTLSMLLGITGNKLNGAWAMLWGLDNGVRTDIASRNLIAFGNAPPESRGSLVKAVEELENALRGRSALDLDLRAMEAGAAIFWDAYSATPEAALRASGRLLPVLLRAKSRPVSALVAATFPLVYRELAKDAEVPDLLKFVPFYDWDRCKTARRELVDAFTASSVWRPGDLALAAYRAGDLAKILRRVTKVYGGVNYIKRVEADLDRLPADCRDQARRAMEEIRRAGSMLYDWHD